MVACAALLAGSVLCAPVAHARKSAAASISVEERALYRDLVTAAKRGEWTKANTLARRAEDPLATAFAEWLYLTDDGSTPSFDELSQFLAGHSTWPYRGMLLTKAEQAIPEDMRARETVDWFGDREPRTGDGAVRLGEAKIALGQRAEGEALIKRAWAEKDFTPDAERRTVAEHGTILQGGPTAARIARLLWQRRTGDATRILDGADGDTRQVAKARMTLITKPQQLNAVIAGLPRSLRDDSGLLYEQARASRLNGDIREAVPFALKADAGSAASKWWPERHALAREALQRGLYQEAYDVTAAHGLAQGADYADAEWLAGWIALRFLDKPARAAEHFTALFKSVSYSVSKARGAYWAARAYEAAGKLADAAAFYDTAASYETTYYGQLAGARLKQSKATLALPADNVRPSDSSSFARSELANATRIASAAGSNSVARPFFMALGEAAATEEDYAFAGKLALELGYPGLAVRIGKKALQDNIVLTDIAYPVVSTPRGESGPEAALVLGITRQESEFDEQAESPSGARGLMQLMPATAKHIAKQAHLPYSPAQLDEGGYNMRLGTAYLGDLIDRFNGSYALAVAAYNAGPTNARRWIEDFGDPRDPNVDPVDWVEKIPFSETRNYVQRVLENTQVYRSRLAKSATPIRIADDLARPNAAKAYGEDLMAYLGGGSTRVASAEDAKPHRGEERPSPKPVSQERRASPASVPAGPESKPEKVAETAPASVEPPKPVEVAAAAPMASRPPLPPAPTVSAQPTAPVVAEPPSQPSHILAPQPKPAKAAEKAKAKPRQIATAKAAAKGKKKSAPSGDDPETAAAEPSGAVEPVPPSANPFGNGQPESKGMPAKCTRMIMDLNGKPRCADRQALNE
jgi:soluble lytic murein transglycosylase